jgi:hypothetical protein
MMPPNFVIQHYYMYLVGILPYFMNVEMKRYLLLYYYNDYIIIIGIIYLEVFIVAIIMLWLDL